jgi:hypothetical protein
MTEKVGERRVSLESQSQVGREVKQLSAECFCSSPKSNLHALMSEGRGIPRIFGNELVSIVQLAVTDALNFVTASGEKQQDHGQDAVSAPPIFIAIYDKAHPKANGR